MVDLSGTTLTWRGLTVYGTRASRHWLSTLDGWEDLPPTRRDSQPRTGHGTFGGTPLSDERTVTVTGACSTPAERDTLLHELQAVMWLSGTTDTEPLTIDHAGRVLTADAQLTRFKPGMGTWSSGQFSWAVEWVCPDPLRYAAPVSVWTLFPTPRGGLEYDLYTDGAGADLGWLDYGLASDTGRLVVTNTGTAPAPVLFQVEGEVAPQGFDIAQLASDRRLRFVGPNSATSVLVLDGATGNVLVDGTADRGGQLTHRDWPVVPAATRVAGVLVPSSLELAFINLGATSSARLTAVVRPGSW